MRKLLFVGMMLAASPVFAQQPGQVAIPMGLAQHLAAYLHFGGTRTEADDLVQQLNDAADAPAKEKAVQSRIDAAVAAAKSGAPAEKSPDKPNWKAPPSLPPPVTPPGP